MSSFSPVLLAETPELRQEIEGIFTREPDALTERLLELDEQARALGYSVTFGAEIEATFAPNGSGQRLASTGSQLIDSDTLYEQVVCELNGAPPGPLDGWNKGAVILPRHNPTPVMINAYDRGTYNPDQADVIEVRTSPAHAEMATAWYWGTMRAIGTVAERHGYMGIILSTHMNTAILKDSHFGGRFIDFTSSAEDSSLLAAIQHNLNTMEPLQTHAGLSPGVAVLEAYPESKSASTTVHRNRLELRHPSIGIVDPRVDMLAVLEAVGRAAQGKLTAVEMNALHHCSGIDITFERNDALGGIRALLNYDNARVLWDHQSRKLVMPTLLQASAGGDFILDDLTQDLTDRAELKAPPTNARAVRQVLGSLSISNGNLRLRGRDAANIVRPIAGNVDGIGETEIAFSTDRYRVVPNVIYDSPEVHAIQRANVTHSSAIRRIMGTSLSTLTPARDAIGRRREIIESQMIEEPDES